MGQDGAMEGMGGVRRCEDGMWGGEEGRGGVRGGGRGRKGEEKGTEVCQSV